MHQYDLRVARAALLFLLAFSAGIAGAQQEPGPQIDLTEALALARENSPLLEVARARIAEADGDLTQASLLLADNPELGVSAGPRFLSQSGEGTEIDAEIELAQRLEIGGQRRHRIARAEALARASRAHSADVQRVVSQAVASLFFGVLAADERLQLARENASLAANLYDIAHARVSAGAAAPLEENTARIRRAEAQRRLIRAETLLGNAEVRLASTIGLDSGVQLRLKGALPGVATLAPLSNLLASATENHPRLLGSRATAEAAESASALAKAEAWPDISLGVSYARDEDDDIVMGGVTIPIPLFNRNQGERERARAASRRAAATARAERLEVEAELRQRYAEYEAANRSVAAFDADMVRSHRENLKLIEVMYDGGKIGFAEVILLQRQVVEGRLGYLDARLDRALAETAARAAAGLELTPPLPGRILP